jgi:hypothetical protein
MKDRIVLHREVKCVVLINMVLKIFSKCYNNIKKSTQSVFTLGVTDV